ncbi:hypothetical protein, conserved in T. vivax [Trypanosoma vivax Y486]|uniref:Uncharacterized protein n=1 Tax=Trypanosoma vivax (strain Y486) TaxID=1055687 RepID=F9WLD0_TRYVY|nr:hypothetical protein, conserved in T. vivax [Trypanosoma vivax Y486]|eukprot:CCD18320.1 hypothetical protein, conserved in T. vivax [Trypanosoma vivax Y486]
MPAPLAPRAFHRVARWCAYWLPVRDVRFEAARASALAEAPFSCKKHSAHPDAHFPTAGRLRGTTPTSSSRNRQASAAHRFFRPILGADVEMAPAPTPAAERELAFGAAAPGIPNTIGNHTAHAFAPRHSPIPTRAGAAHTLFEQPLPDRGASRSRSRKAAARVYGIVFRRVCGASARGGCSPLFDRAPAEPLFTWGPRAPFSGTPRFHNACGPVAATLRHQPSPRRRAHRTNAECHLRPLCATRVGKSRAGPFRRGAGGKAFASADEPVPRVPRCCRSSARVASLFRWGKTKTG